MLFNHYSSSDKPSMKLSEEQSTPLSLSLKEALHAVGEEPSEIRQEKKKKHFVQHQVLNRNAAATYC